MDLALQPKRLSKRSDVLARRGLSSSLTSLAAMVIGVVGGIATARALGPVSRGDLAAWKAWVMLAVWLGSFGLDEALVDARRRFGGPLANLRGEIAPWRIISLAVVAAFSLLVASFSIGPSSTTVRLLAATVLFATASLYAFEPLAVLRIESRYGAWNQVRILAAASSALPTVALSLVGWLSLEVAVWLFAASAMTTAIVARLAAGGAPSVRAWPRLRESSHHLRYGLMSTAAAMPAGLTLRLDHLLLAALAGRAQLGAYAVASTVTGLGNGLSLGLQQTFFPSFTTDQTEARSIQRLVLITLCSSSLLALAIAAASQPLIPLIFGAPFARASTLAAILCIGLPFACASAVVSSALKSAGRLRLIATIEWVAVGPQALALLIFIPRYGATAAAAVTSIAFAGIFVALMMVAKSSVDRRT